MSGRLDAHVVVRRSGFSLDLELAIEPGCTAALLGPNGSGKSTTVDVIAGLRPLDGGHVVLGDRVLDRPADGVFVPPEARGIGVVFQRYLLFDHLDVTDNVAFGPMSQGMRRRDARAAAARWIEALDLERLARRRPPELSGGQAQRVAVARALAARPDLVLLDEPMAALDVTARGRLRRLLRDVLGTFDGPRLLITHDPADAFLLADEIHVLEDGRVIQSGSPDAVRRHPASAYVAALAGTNLLAGRIERGVITLDDHPHQLQAADTSMAGPVLVTVHPTAVALHPDRPHGSPRNAWSTAVADVEPLGDTTRITLAAPLPLSVDVTPGAIASLGLGVGSPIWASVKATEIGLTPASA